MMLFIRIPAWSTPIITGHILPGQIPFILQASKHYLNVNIPKWIFIAQSLQMFSIITIKPANHL